MWQISWIDVSMPHSRKRRLKDHSKLVQIREVDPNSTDIFENNVIDTFYPQRHADMEDVCLYDFVAEYTKCGTDSDGNVVYRKLGKPVLPNHKLYNPTRRQRRGLLLLSAPPVCSFRNEETSLDGENAESAFNRHMDQNEAMNTHSQETPTYAQIESVEKKTSQAGKEEKVWNLLNQRG